MKELFTQIESLVPTLGEWCSVEKACTLAAMVVGLRPLVTLEIGIFSGASFLPMALAHQQIKHGIAFGIDPWENAASVEGQTGADAEWWRTVDLEGVHQRFMAARDSLGLSDYCSITRSRSDDVKPPIVIDLFHLDGNHGAQAIKDVERFAPNVRGGGIVVMDDLNWAGGAVSKAADRLTEMGFIKLYDLGTGAVFQRTTRSPG